MKKKRFSIILLLCLAAAFACPLTGCGGENADPGEYVDLKEAADTYTAEDAEKAGYVVITGLKVTSGQEEWDSFISKTEAGEPAKMRIATDYTPDQNSPEGSLYLKEVEYDGQKYISRSCYEGELHQSEYKYMLRFEEAPPRPMPSYVTVLYGVLADDDTLTWDDIYQHMIGLNPAGSIGAYDIIYTHYTH